MNIFDNKKKLFNKKESEILELFQQCYKEMHIDSE